MKWLPTFFLFLLLLTSPALAIRDKVQRRPDLHFPQNGNIFEKSIHSIIQRLHRISDHVEAGKAHIETNMNHGLSRLEALNVDAVLTSGGKRVRL